MIKSPLSVIRSNRKELRKRGCSAGDLLILEAVAFKSPQGGLVRVSVAAVGRMVGVGRSSALRSIQKLERLGAVVRIGAAMMLSVRFVLKQLLSDAVERAKSLRRAFCLHRKRLRERSELIKALETKAESESVAHCATHRAKYISPDAVPVGHGSVVEGYVPVHLRKAR